MMVGNRRRSASVKRSPHTNRCWLQGRGGAGAAGGRTGHQGAAEGSGEHQSVPTILTAQARPPPSIHLHRTQHCPSYARHPPQHSLKLVQAVKQLGLGFGEPRLCRRKAAFVHAVVDCSRGQERAVGGVGWGGGVGWDRQTAAMRAWPATQLFPTGGRRSEYKGGAVVAGLPHLSHKSDHSICLCRLAAAEGTGPPPLLLLLRPPLLLPGWRRQVAAPAQQSCG